MPMGSFRQFGLSLLIVWSVLWVGGCASGPQAGAEDGAAAAHDDPAEPGNEAERYAQRIASAMARGGAYANEAPEVKWIEPGSPVPDTMIEPGRRPDPPAVPTIAAIEPEPAPTPPDLTIEAPAAPASRGEVFARLRDTIARENAPAIRKALDAATISVLDPAGGFDRQVLDPLGYEQRDVVERYLQAVAMMYSEVARGESQFDRQAIDLRLDELFGHQPIRIREVELCRRVSGYGVYEPFESHTFLAGREQKAIVYVELDHYQSLEKESGFEVRLRQEVAIYNESDGLLVWRNEPVEISDDSRNRRRDFFVVQLVTMPARMTVGKFRLKVSITDLHGGSVDETSIPVEFVADQSLVKK